MSQSMLGEPTEERVRVRYGETDQMGHAYYANYLLWYEQARGVWCRDRGFTYKQLEDMGYKLPVVEVWTRYKGELKYDDVAVIKVRLGEIKRAAIKFEYEVVNDTTGAICTEGYTWHVFAAGEPLKAIAIPEDARALLLRDPSHFDRL